MHSTESQSANRSNSFRSSITAGGDGVVQDNGNGNGNASGPGRRAAPPPIKPKPSAFAGASSISATIPDSTTPLSSTLTKSTSSSSTFGTSLSRRSLTVTTTDSEEVSSTVGDLRRAFEKNPNSAPLFMSGAPGVGAGAGKSSTAPPPPPPLQQHASVTRVQSPPFGNTSMTGQGQIASGENRNSYQPRSATTAAPPRPLKPMGLRRPEDGPATAPVSNVSSLSSPSSSSTSEGVDNTQMDFGNLRARFQSQATVSPSKQEPPRPQKLKPMVGITPKPSSLISPPAPPQPYSVFQQQQQQQPSSRLSLDSGRSSSSYSLSKSRSNSVTDRPTTPRTVDVTGSPLLTPSLTSSNSFKRPPPRIPGRASPIPSPAAPLYSSPSPSQSPTPVTFVPAVPVTPEPEEEEERNPFMGSDEDEPNIDSDRSSTRSPLPSRSPSFNSTGPTPAKNVSKLQQNPVFQQLNTRGVGVTAPPAPARAAPRPDSPPKLPSRSGSTSSVVDSPEEAERKHRLDKRRRVVLELLETEISYSKDMLLLQEVYVTDMQASNQFTAADEKIIFTNLGEVISLTLDFVALLTPACGGGLDQPYDDDGTFVGEAFLQMISRIRRVYSEYCKRQEGSAQYLQELDQRKEFKPFFDACTEKCQGKTTTWDLASILIKPVQRVLKYPLLINQIHALTPPEHADYESLVKVQKDMLQVAEEINDIKKRKDIVEKIVGSKKKNDSDIVHGFNKKFSRTTQQLRQAVGGSDGTVDILFEALLEKFNMQQRLARDFVKYIQSWLVSIKQYFDTQEAFAISLMEIYGLMPLHRNDENNSIRLVREYHKSLTQFSKTIGRELENRLKRTVYRSIEGFLRLFSGPLQVMKKREKKLLDYDSVRGMRDRGETVDKNMQDSADAYIAINEQLVDELPKFLGLTTQYFDLVVTEFSKIQMFFYAQVRAKANDFYSEFMDPQAAKDLKAYTEQMNVFEDYIEAMRRVDGPVERLERIRILQNVTAMHDTAFRDVRDAEQFQQQRRSRARSSSTPLPPLPARRDQNEEDAYDQKGSLSKSDSQGDLLSSPSGETETDSEQWLPRYYPGEDENPFEMPESIFQDGMSVASDDIFDGRTNVFGQPLSADTSTYSLSSTTEPSLGNGPPALDEGMDMDEIGLAQALFECTAIYPYSSKEERQLSFDAGESIIVFGLNEDGWYFGKKVGKEVTGWFPSSYTIQI